MIFVDANIFLAYDNTKDAHHQKAFKILLEIGQGLHGRPFTSDYVLNEVVGVTFRKKGKERAVFIGEQIMKSFLIINNDDHILKEAWELFRRTESNLNLVDCTNVIVTHLAKAGKIATFDEEFNKIKSIEVIP